MLYTLERGEVISKQNALNWGAAAMPVKWHELIGPARLDRFVPWNDPPRPGSVERTLAFVEYVHERARTRPYESPDADLGVNLEERLPQGSGSSRRPSGAAPRGETN